MKALNYYAIFATSDYVVGRK